MKQVAMHETLKDLHPQVNLLADYLCVQRIVFLHNISRGYDFRTVENIKDFGKKYSKSKMLRGIKKCVNMYHARELEVTQLNTENDFKCIEEDIRPIRLNMIAANEHVGNVERSTRTIK